MLSTRWLNVAGGSKELLELKEVLYKGRIEKPRVNALPLIPILLPLIQFTITPSSNWMDITSDYKVNYTSTINVNKKVCECKTNID